MLAFFGILPTPLSLEESVRQACRAAVEMLDAIKRINDQRVERDEPALLTGIGINSGPLTAGGLGTTDRLNYTIIGDTVNSTQRIQEITREFGESGVVISKFALESLNNYQDDFHTESLGEHIFKGKREPMELFRLWTPNHNHPNEELQ
jgi:adenylate cyclase